MARPQAETRSLRSLAEDQVLDELAAAMAGLKSPFCVGGNLGGLGSQGRVCLAVGGGTGAGASGGATVYELPGEEDLEALLQQCEPAAFGRGTETGRVWPPGARGGARVPTADRRSQRSLPAPSPPPLPRRPQ